MKTTLEESITLSKLELRSITGYACTCKQLEVLKQRGFDRAFKSRNGVVLERSHYIAVTTSHQKVKSGAQTSKTPNLSFMRGAS